MLKTNKQIKKTIFTAIFAVLMIPTLASADNSYGFDGGGYDSGWGSWGGGSSAYDYTSTYSYQPIYADYYTSPSYNYGSNYGSSYTPSYSGSSYGGYSLPSYGSSYSASSIPSSTHVSTDNKNTSANTNTNTSNSNSSATSSSSATAINNNVNNNNVYVYTNPTGNAVVHNPQHQALSAYCIITPSNPKTGQTVTATAYATGGIGNYTYTWGGDINAVSGASTSFTSYTTGIKYINVTVRSDQEIVTKTCTVTFESNTTVYGSYYNSYTPSYTGGSSVNLTPGITSGTPVSGVYLSQLPATGLSLSFFDYMIATMVVILGAVFTFIHQARKRLTVENI